MSVKIIGDDEVVNFLLGIERNAPRIIKSWLRDEAIDGVKSLQRYILNVGAVDTMELMDGIHYEINSRPNAIEAVIRPSDKADDYASYVEYGTKPHFPPIEAIRPWAERHGIPVFAVAKSIAENGTDPRYFARDSYNEEIQPNTTRNVQRLADRLLGGI